MELDYGNDSDRNHSPLFTMNWIGITTMQNDLNLSFINYSSEIAGNNSASGSLRMASSSVVSSSLMFGIGVFGNVLALIVLALSPKHHRRTIFYRLVAGLTSTDLIGITVLSTMVIVVYVKKEWVGGVYMCNFFGFCMLFFGYATMFIVCTMSIERVLCIRHPLLYNTRLSVKHATILLVMCWLAAAFISSLPLMGFGKIIKKWPNTWCFIEIDTHDPVTKAFNYLYGILALSVISVTMCCNFVVIYTILMGRRSKKLLNQGGNNRKYNDKSHQYAECQMLILLIGITVVFSTCYAPLMVRLCKKWYISV